jgi:hypothetical protein
MPNGKGALECCYCRHFAGQHGYGWGAYDAALCQLHNVMLPASEDHLQRICCHFEPHDSYWTDNPGDSCPPARRFAWFGRDLEPGVLYFFFYNSPDKIAREVVLRKADP